MQTTEQQAQGALASLEKRAILELPADKDAALKVLGSEVQRLNGVLETTHEKFFDLYKALLLKNKEIAALKSQIAQTLADSQQAEQRNAAETAALRRELQDSAEALRSEKSLHAGLVAEAARSREDKDGALRFASQHKQDAQDAHNRMELLRSEFAQLVKARDEAQNMLVERNRELEALRSTARQHQDEADRKKRDLQKELMEVQADLTSKTELENMLRAQVKQIQSEQERMQVLMLQKDEQATSLMGEMATLIANQKQPMDRHLSVVAMANAPKGPDADALSAQRALMANLKDAEVLNERLRLEGLVKDQEYLKLKAMFTESEEQKLLLFKQGEEAREEAMRFREEDNKWLERLEQLRGTYEVSIDKLCREVHQLSSERIKSQEREAQLRREVSELSVRLELQKERKEGLTRTHVLPPTAGLLRLGGLSESKLLTESPLPNRPSKDGLDPAFHLDPNRGLQANSLKYAHNSHRSPELAHDHLYSPETATRGAQQGRPANDDGKWDDLMSRIRLVGITSHTS